MDSSYDGVDNWETWVYGSDWTSDYTYYAENPTRRSSEGFRDFDGGWSTAISHSTGGNDMRYAREGDQPLPQACKTEEDTSSSTLAHQGFQQHAPSNMFTLATIIFPDLSTLHRTDPSYSGQKLQRQKPRFEGDMYTALWVQGEGTERAGWCGFCSTWHKLKDSAFVRYNPPPNNCPLADISYPRTTTCTTRMGLAAPQAGKSMVRKAFNTVPRRGRSFVDVADGSTSGPEIRRGRGQRTLGTHTNVTRARTVVRWTDLPSPDDICNLICGGTSFCGGRIGYIQRQTARSISFNSRRKHFLDWQRQKHPRLRDYVIIFPLASGRRR